jgi:predicted RecA/RadA family phage recombinase
MAANEAVFHYGDYVEMVPYTPGADVPAGEVVLLGDIVGICHVAIPSGELGSLAVQGGVYTCTGDAAIAVGKKVYWDNVNNKVTETATANKVFGYTVVACSGNGAAAECCHNPAM